jgi:diacylglycerol kinase family enzyme
VDGTLLFSGKVSCVLVGNVATVTGAITVFVDAKPDHGWLDVAVVTARGVVQWMRVLGRMATGHSDRSPLTRTTRGREIDVRWARKTLYELDGGDRPSTSRMMLRIEPGAVAVHVPPRPS